MAEITWCIERNGPPHSQWSLRRWDNERWEHLMYFSTEQAAIDAMKAIAKPPARPKYYDNLGELVSDY